MGLSTKSIKKNTLIIKLSLYSYMLVYITVVLRAMDSSQEKSVPFLELC